MLSEILEKRFGAVSYPRSLRRADGLELALARLRDRASAEVGTEANTGEDASRRLMVLAEGAGASGFEGERESFELAGRNRTLLACPLSPGNAQALQRRLPELVPKPMGNALAAGCGDRLGLATPGHLRAARDREIVPFVAQQSIREMERSGRSAERVMADAVFGALQEGWDTGFGSDADHLKRPEHIDRCLRAGFTSFTLDPSNFVEDDADAAPRATLRARWDAQDWDALEAKPSDLVSHYVGRPLPLPRAPAEGVDEESLLKSLVKYGRALAHVAALSRHLAEAAGASPFEIEVSVDETRSPTSLVEHYIVVSELRRLGVDFVSLAPRFAGEFEKGVDYRGDLSRFRREFALHAALARELGDYKLSLHSGSDKFALYPICAELAEGRFHLKTAGTSWLAALQCVGELAPELLREIWGFARERYAGDRASYAVSACVDREPRPDALSDAELPDLFARDGARQILHVTFGSVLLARDAAGAPRFRARLVSALSAGEERHAEILERHFSRHLEPFAPRG